MPPFFCANTGTSTILVVEDLHLVLLYHTLFLKNFILLVPSTTLGTD